MLALADVLTRYGAREARFTRAGGSGESALGPGGSLTTAVDRHGVLPLAASLEDGEMLALEDGDVSLELVRRGAVATLRVKWASGPAYEETLAVRPGEPAPFRAGDAPPVASPVVARGERVKDLKAAIHDPTITLHVLDDGVYTNASGARAIIPAIRGEDLGSQSFRDAHGVRASYIAGAMAGGIGSADILIAMSRAGLLAFFGAGGLPVEAVQTALKTVRTELGDRPRVGFNLLHNPVEPQVEEHTVDLYLEHGIQRASASAFMRLTRAVVRYRLSGIEKSGDEIVVPNKVFAKISRGETAEMFLRPAPKKLVEELVADGILTKGQAELAALVPMAEDVTMEADSGGHTDRRPLVGMLPVIRRLRDRVSKEERYAERGIHVRVGGAGGIGDPASVHAAFALGADYILTGSVNQASVEAGTSRLAKEMVAEATAIDCTTGPAPDMFEIGAEVQVLGRGTLYAQRAGRLYELYRRYNSLDDVPKADREKVEKTILQRSFEDVWTETAAYWSARDPREVERAHADAHHKMALVFRWYLGMTSRWARTGEASRKRDFQIWCGPAAGVFNDWVRGSWLEPLDARHVVDIAWALLDGGAVMARVHQAKALGLALPPGTDDPPPLQRRR
jgi:PfaD family protein